MIANAEGREEFRVIDARIQYLRKSGVITHEKKKYGGSGKWELTDRSEEFDSMKG